MSTLNHFAKRIALDAETHSFHEELKREGWDDLRANSGLSMDARCRGLLKVITSHFLRSIAANFYRDCTWRAYVQSWLIANGDDRDEQDVVKRLREIFGKPRYCGLEQGTSYWLPKIGK